MTWREFRQAVEKAGVKEEDTIEVFDRKMFDELVGVYRALLVHMDSMPEDDVAGVAEWVDMLRDRYLTGFGRSHEAIGYGSDDILLKPPVAFRDDDPAEGRGDGIVKVYYTSVLPTELLS